MIKANFYALSVVKKKGENTHLESVIRLPESEFSKVILLLLSLFRIACYRRFLLERNHPDKWWYWDLSDTAKLHLIKKRQQRKDLRLTWVRGENKFFSLDYNCWQGFFHPVKS